MILFYLKVEERLQKLLVPLQTEEKALMKLDSIFKALGVETMEDVEQLTKYFVRKPESSGGDEPEMIHPNEVMKAVRKFSIQKRDNEALNENQFNAAARLHELEEELIESGKFLD